jgi:hypothetical protein
MESKKAADKLASRKAGQSVSSSVGIAQQAAHDAYLKAVEILTRFEKHHQHRDCYWRRLAEVTYIISSMHHKRINTILLSGVDVISYMILLAKARWLSSIIKRYTL